mmetsp:Transcript_19396/g.48004  ORF Transcript_19396/g.48004 Transcript_19396/m.48004 type:complete len:248 (+) Transcript_19396:1363-2106(+)
MKRALGIGVIGVPASEGEHVVRHDVVYRHGAGLATQMGNRVRRTYKDVRIEEKHSQRPHNVLHLPLVLHGGLQAGVDLRQLGEELFVVVLLQTQTVCCALAGSQERPPVRQITAEDQLDQREADMRPDLPPYGQHSTREAVDEQDERPGQNHQQVRLGGGISVPGAHQLALLGREVAEEPKVGDDEHPSRTPADGADDNTPPQSPDDSSAAAAVVGALAHGILSSRHDDGWAIQDETRGTDLVHQHR